nr:MAG TPA: hypothetical protein [Caudoviricetes sp.]
MLNISSKADDVRRICGHFLCVYYLWFRTPVPCG